MTIYDKLSLKESALLYYSFLLWKMFYEILWLVFKQKFKKKRWKQKRDQYSSFKRRDYFRLVPSLVLLCTHTLCADIDFLYRGLMFSKYTVTQDIGRSITIIFVRFWRGDRPYFWWNIISFVELQRSSSCELENVSKFMNSDRKGRNVQAARAKAGGNTSSKK